MVFGKLMTPSKKVCHTGEEDRALCNPSGLMKRAWSSFWLSFGIRRCTTIKNNLEPHEWKGHNCRNLHLQNRFWTNKMTCCHSWRPNWLNKSIKVIVSWKFWFRPLQDHNLDTKDVMPVNRQDVSTDWENVPESGTEQFRTTACAFLRHGQTDMLVSWVGKEWEAPLIQIIQFKT